MKINFYTLIISMGVANFLFCDVYDIKERVEKLNKYELTVEDRKFVLSKNEELESILRSGNEPELFKEILRIKDQVKSKVGKEVAAEFQLKEETLFIYCFSIFLKNKNIRFTEKEMLELKNIYLKCTLELKESREYQNFYNMQRDVTLNDANKYYATYNKLRINRINEQDYSFLEKTKKELFFEFLRNILGSS